MPDMTGGEHENREGGHSPLHSTDISYTTTTTMGSSLSTPSWTLTVPGSHAHAHLVNQVATSSSSIRESNGSKSDSAQRASMESTHEQVPSSHIHASTPAYPRTRPPPSFTSTSSSMERAQHQEPPPPRHESEDDLTMGDIAMLSTARPSIDMGRIHYPGSLEVGHATSAHRAHHIHLHHEDAPISARTIQAHSSSIGPYSGRQGAVMHPATPSFSSQSKPSNSHVSGLPSSSPLPGAARKNEEQDASPYAHTGPSSSSFASPKATIPTPPACHAAMQSLLSSSRQTLPPLPSGDSDPSPVPPGFNRNESSTSSNTLSGTSTPSGPVAVLPTPTALISANPALAQPQSHDASSLTAGAAVPATAASSSSKTTTASTSTSNANTVPSHVHADGRYKRYQETQADYRPGGYARIKEGDRLNHGRYEVVKKLGVGHFSVVWLAWDREGGGYVAIKVVRSSKRYSRAALHEDKLLTVIQGPRDERKSYIVSFLDSFDERAWEGHESHVCLVFELMGMSLTDVLRKNDFNGLPIKTTKLIAKQVLTGLSYLHSLGIAHTDIKPDNILLYHSSRTMSKMLRTQLEADEAEKDRIAAEEALNPKPEPINWLEHKPKIPGLNPQQIREIQLARIRSEARRWTITPSMPLDSPIPFANGKKIVKEFVLANKHLYKAPRRGGYLPAPPKSTEVSTSQSGKNSLELDRTSAAHPGSTDVSPKAENAEKKVETASTQTTPTKDIASNATSTRSSISPKGKGTDTTSTTESSMTAPSSRQSSKSPHASLNRLKPASNASSVFGKDPAGFSFGRQFEKMSISDLLKAQQQADEVDVVGIDKGRTHVEGLFATRHPRTSSNESTGQQETDFEKLLRQPMEYDIPGSSISSSGLPALGGLSIGGPSPMFMQKSPSDSGGSEIFSPASTTMTRFFPIHGAAPSTDSPASTASTPIGSSPELLMARKLPSPVWPHPSASYATAMPIPCAKALNRTGSTASIFGSPSFTSFSPTEHNLMSLQEIEYRARGGAESMAHPRLARARSDYGLEDGQGFVSLPSSPPSHPTSYLSLGSMSPEVTMGMGLRRTGAGGSGLPGLARSGSDASVGGIFDFAIQEQQEDETNTEDQAALDQLGSGYIKGDDANATIIAGTSKPRGLPGSNSLIQGLGLSMSSSFAQLKSLAISKSMSDGQAVSPLVSASPPTSMTSSFHSRMSQISEASPPSIQPSSGEVDTTAAMPITQNQSQTQGPTSLVHEYKIERRLDSPARVRSDPLLNVHVKLSDLGNAIFYHELKSKGALPENVCTRQYRPPENIIGAEYNLGVDVWALGCVIFEMITGEMLFNPSQEKYRYTKEDDLLGQQIEFLGPFSREFAMSGRKSYHFFNRHAQILRVRLSPWLMFDVMVKKYYMPRAKARKFCDFLSRMLEPDPAKRATVEELLLDPWINEIEEDDDMVLYREKKKQPAPAPAEV